MVQRIGLILFFVKLVSTANETPENPRVKVSIETNFGAALKSNGNGQDEVPNCGKIIDDSLPIGKYPWFSEIYVSKVR